MAQSNWEADKMLDVYIYDYLLKRNLHNSAKAFMSEGKVASDPVAIDAPGGFLFEWWSVFWDIFIARTNEKHSEVAAAYIEAQQMKAREQQQHQIQMQQLQMMQQRAQLQRREASLSAPMNGLSSEGILGQSTASVLAAKMYEERMKHPHPLDSDSSLHLLDSSRMNLLKASSNHTGSLVQAGSGSVSAALQQIQARTQQNIDIKCDNLGMTQRSIPTDPSMYGQGIMQGKSGLGNAGLNQGVSALTLKGWPLNGMDQLRPSLIQQAQKPFLQAQNQIQLMTPQQQQQLLAQAQAQGSLGNSLNYGDMDPRRLRVLPRGTLNGKDGQPAGNDSSISSPMHSSSPKVRVGSQDQADYLMKNYAPASQMKTTQIQQSSVQTQQDQVQQNNRKRKPPSSSGAANSTGTGNTLGPLSPPSTPSTHTPGDGGSVAGSLPQVNTMSKGLMMYGSEGTGGLVSSSNQLDEIEHFGDVGSLDDNVESFLSHDDGDGRDLFGTLKRSPTDHNAEASKVFTFNEVGCIHTSNGKVVCCHFSSDGKLLASAGHDKKVVLWNMDTLQTESTTEEHSHPITDVRFRPNSTHFATSSFDKTIRLWNAADPRYSLHAFSGHTSNVVSIDFHPKKTDVLCSCDSNGEMRIWNVGQYSCSRISEGGNSQVRFHPRMGNLLAAASDNVVSIFDVDSDRKTYTLQGHAKNVHSICWDSTGDLLASVSPDSVRVWSLTSGNCIHELSSNGNTFYSCVFHPTYSPLLVIGGYQSLELWNLLENKSMTIAMAHDGLISALAQTPINGMIASASHDRAVKLWK